MYSSAIEDLLAAASAAQISRSAKSLRRRFPNRLGALICPERLRIALRERGAGLETGAPFRALVAAGLLLLCLLLPAVCRAGDNNNDCLPNWTNACVTNASLDLGAPAWPAGTVTMPNGILICPGSILSLVPVVVIKAFCFDVAFSPPSPSSPEEERGFSFGA